MRINGTGVNAHAQLGCDLTPVLLTYNEEPNLGRTLSALSWAKQVVIVDSGSTDGTERLARSYTNVRWFYRRFDRHREQWLHAIKETGIGTAWVLALDADMIVPEGFPSEFTRSVGAGGYEGGILSFVYRALGRDLMGSLYPPDLRVFRPNRIDIIQDGHTQRFRTDGKLYHFKCRVVHDDRKPLDHWTQSQLRYSLLEWERLRQQAPAVGFKNKLRSVGWMPLLAGAASYVRAGGPLRGRAALEYAYERLAFETLLAMRFLRGETLAKTSGTASCDPQEHAQHFEK